jgi:galactokinase
MNNVKQLLRKIDDGVFDIAFTRLYGADAIQAQRTRYKEVLTGFGDMFGIDREVILFSAPGRTEIGGNHTDHNHGCVLAASVNLDIIAAASPTQDEVIQVKSKGYDLDTVKLDELSVIEEEKGQSSSLIRGIADHFVQNGLKIGGFDAYTTSNVLKGSGLSSSAAFEVLIGTVLSHLYNNGNVSSIEIAKIAQYAENVHFGKPCGLMDQMASSIGGIITIDFADPQNPVVKKVDFDFSKSGYHLCIVDSGGNHADLTDEYASVTIEMKAVSNSLGVSFLRETSIDNLMKKIPEIRQQHGDRAVLRAFHFLRDNERVKLQVEALENNDFEEFKRLIIESGHSSFEYLQNVYTSNNVREQGLSLALCLAQGVLSGKGAWRVHGGGFAGTTQNFVPSNLLDEFRKQIESVFGEGSCHVLSIRPDGGVCLDSLI